MSTEALAAARPLSTFEQLRYAREIVQIESRALEQLASRLDERFAHAVRLVTHSAGSVIVTGMGKAGLIGQKIAATLSSTGARAHFLHPGEAYHGDLGRVHKSDVVLALSQSGETEEITRLLPSLRNLGAPIIAMTRSAQSTLGRAAVVVLELGPLQEACPHGLAPTTSTTAMLALGDALALVASRVRDFRAEDFARFHPGGSLGRRLSKVADHMRPLTACRLAQSSATVREVIVACTKPGRRTGAIMLTDEHGTLRGLFTDSDLARLFEHDDLSALDRPISHRMTTNPLTVEPEAMLSDAQRIMAERKISELPVIDPRGKPVGLLDITDMVGLLPPADEPRPGEGPENEEKPTDSANGPRIAIYPRPNPEESSQ